MKKLLSLIALLLFSCVIFAQVTPVPHLRIANRTMAFGQNLPVSSQIFCTSDSTLWETKSAVDSSKSINSAISSLFLVNKDLTAYFALKLDKADTAAMLTPYITNGEANSALALKKNSSDSTAGTDYTSRDRLRTELALKADKSALANKADLIGGKLDANQLPAIVFGTTWMDNSETSMLSHADAYKGDVSIRADVNKTFILSTNNFDVLADWKMLKTPLDAVASVNGNTGVVVLTPDSFSDAATTNKFVTAGDKTNWNGKVTGNTAITGATKTKITYDSKGLVTSGADATTADIAASTNKNYVTDAQVTLLGNTSGTNSGDNAVNSNYSSLESNATHTGDATGSTALTLATVNSNVGTYNNVTVNGKGLVTSASNASYEPSFTKNTGFNKNFGSTTGTVLEGRTFGTAANSATGDFLAYNGTAANSTQWNGFTVDNSTASSGDFFRYNGSTWLHTGLVSADIPNNAANITGSATKWNNNTYDGSSVNSSLGYLMGYSTTGNTWTYYEPGPIKTWLGLGSNAYTSYNLQNLGTSDSPIFNNVGVGISVNSSTRAIQAPGFNFQIRTGDGGHYLGLDYGGGISYDGYPIYHAGNFYNLTFSTAGDGSTDYFNGSTAKTISYNSVGAQPLENQRLSTGNIPYFSGLTTYNNSSSNYNTTILGTSGGARKIFLAGQIGYSNGFTVEYDGTKMLYGFASGNSTFDGNLTVNGTVTATGGNSTQWNTAYTDRNKWDGGSTGLDASTGRRSLGLVIGTDVLAYRTFGTAANSATGDFLAYNGTAANSTQWNGFTVDNSTATSGDFLKYSGGTWLHTTIASTDIPIGTSLTNSGSVLNTIQDIRTSAGPTFTGLTIGAAASTKVEIRDGGSINVLSPAVNDNLIVRTKGGGSILMNYGDGSNVTFYGGGYSGVATIDNVGNGTFNGLLSSNSLKIPLTGILKGNGSSAVTVAVAGTDYVVPSALPTFKVESFTESTTGSTGTVFSLSNTPKSSTAINVTLNGTPLKTSQYTLSGSTVQVTIPSCQYDNLNVSYSF